MYFEDAWAIIREHNLIPRKVSKHVLRSIVLGDPVSNDVVSPYVSPEEIEAISRDYHRKRRQLGEAVLCSGPRNLVFYHLARERVPSFDWSLKYSEDGRGLPDVTLRRPTVRGLKPSLVSLLLRDIDHAADSQLHETYPSVHRLSTESVSVLARLFATSRFVSPDERAMEKFVRWIERGREGHPLTVLTPVCPDYEAHEIAKNIFRYTFDGIGSEIGIVANRFLDALPLIAKTFRALDLDVTYVVPIGDFEAFSVENLQRLDVSEANFMDCLRRSQDKLKTKSLVPLVAPLFTELCGGRTEWDKIFHRIRQSFANDDFGRTGLTKGEVEAIAVSREPLYRRWSNRKGPFDNYAMLTNQAAEYASMGRIAADTFEDPLVLGADHARMAPFFSFDQELPVLYLRNNYIGVR